MILNGTEYRLFFTRETSKGAQKKCQEWGKDWMSAPLSVDLIKGIDRELQSCIKQMIESNSDVELWSNTEKELGYFIGGGIAKKRGYSRGWYWHKGEKIPLREEVNIYDFH